MLGCTRKTTTGVLAWKREVAGAYIFLLDVVPRILPYLPSKDVGKVRRYSLVVKLSCKLPHGEAIIPEACRMVRATSKRSWYGMASAYWWLK
jgi:hypothetical protein